MYLDEIKVKLTCKSTWKSRLMVLIAKPMIMSGLWDVKTAAHKIHKHLDIKVEDI